MERHKITLHYADGRIVKDCSQDFAPNKPQFHRVLVVPTARHVRYL